MKREVQWREPDEALSLIRGKLEAAKLEIRSHYRHDKLAELGITNPANQRRGTMSINQDGFVTWECTIAISNDKGIREIIDVVTGLFAAPVPGETANRDDRLPPAHRQEM
jgi:hypothetical protein